ncbi:hypothetical protein RKD37_000171 [Streptomyces ambofaciens]
MLHVSDEAELAQVAGVVVDRAPLEAEFAGRRLCTEREVSFAAASHSLGEELGQLNGRAAGLRVVPGSDHELHGREEVRASA